MHYSSTLSSTVHMPHRPKYRSREYSSTASAVALSFEICKPLVSFHSGWLVRDPHLSEDYFNSVMQTKDTRQVLLDSNSLS